MTSHALEWLIKAEADRRSAALEFGVESHPNLNLVCFLAQQCAEKMFKALLTRDGLEFPLTHDLVLLLRLARTNHDALSALSEAAVRMSGYAVAFHYPGEDADMDLARLATQDMDLIFRTIRPLLDESN